MVGLVGVGGRKYKIKSAAVFRSSLMPMVKAFVIAYEVHLCCNFRKTEKKLSMELSCVPFLFLFYFVFCTYAPFVVLTGHFLKLSGGQQEAAPTRLVRCVVVAGAILRISYFSFY